MTGRQEVIVWKSWGLNTLDPFGMHTLMASLSPFGKLYRRTGLVNRGAIHPFLTLFIYSLTGNTSFFFSQATPSCLRLALIHVKKNWKISNGKVWRNPSVKRSGRMTHRSFCFPSIITEKRDTLNASLENIDKNPVWTLSSDHKPKRERKK